MDRHEPDQDQGQGSPRAWVDVGPVGTAIFRRARLGTRRGRLAHKLVPYMELFDVRLHEFPKLSAKRLFDEVPVGGCDGGFAKGERASGPMDFETFGQLWERRHALAVVLGYSSSA